ncbi:MAG: hypothetical protein E7618_01760 [Ruminococcaceae bacterium]|nr:hypothetical protein [Oscillospiraceae bacterium]
MDATPSIGRDAVKLTLSKMTVLLMAMVSAMLLSRYYSYEEYGTYSQLLTIINLGTTAIMMGLPNSLNYFLASAETDAERRRFLNVYYTLSTLLSAVVGAVLVAVTPLLVSYFENPLIADFLYFLAVFPWTKILMSGIENILVVYQRTNLITHYRLANSIALVAVILLVRFMEWSFGTYMMLYLVTEALFALAVYAIAARQAGGLRPALDPALIRRIFTFSIPIGLATMVGTLNIELDKLVIGGLMNTESLAIYTNASKEMPITIIATSVTAVLLPQMVKLLKREEHKTAARLWSDATYLSFAIIGFLALALFVFAPEVITILYSAKYLPGVTVFRIYCLVLLFRCTYFGMILNATGHTRMILYSSLGSLLLNFGLNYVFYTLFGFEGPAVASLLAQALMSLLQLYWSSRILKIRLRELFDWSALLRALTVNLLLAAVFLVLKILLPLQSVWGAIPEAILLGLLWIALFLLTFFRSLKAKWKALT